MVATRMRRCGFTMLAAVACSHARATDWPVATMVRQNEVVRSQAPVSGGYIRGLEYIDDSSATDVKRLFVRLRDATTTTLCLDIYRRDGSYGAAYVYTLPGTMVGGYAEIPIQTKFPEFYTRVTSHDLAAVARIARDGLCPAEQGPIVPVFWNKVSEQGSASHLVVAIQTGDRDATLHVGGKSSAIKKKIPCELAPEAHVASFDSLCEMSELPNGHDLELDIEACAFGECGIIQKATLSP
jgi:hypothetical protein